MLNCISNYYVNQANLNQLIINLFDQRRADRLDCPRWRNKIFHLIRLMVIGRIRIHLIIWHFCFFELEVIKNITAEQLVNLKWEKQIYLFRCKSNWNAVKGLLDFPVNEIWILLNQVKYWRREQSETSRNTCDTTCNCRDTKQKLAMVGGSSWPSGLH